MIRLAKTHLIVFALAVLLPGMSVGNEKYPLLAEKPVITTLVEAQQAKATAPASGNTINEIKVAAVRLIVPEAQVASNPELGAAPEEPVEPGEPSVSEPPVLIAVIIDDLGNQRGAGERTVELEGPVACAIMPHTRHATYLAQRAFAVGKEVMLHLPMQPMQMQRIAGPGEISLDTQRRQLEHILQIDLDSVPHVVGVNNHMGSLITRHPGHMRWLMY